MSHRQLAIHLTPGDRRTGSDKFAALGANPLDCSPHALMD
jgi:hypothetical protein